MTMSLSRILSDTVGQPKGHLDRYLHCLFFLPSAISFLCLTHEELLTGSATIFIAFSWPWVYKAIHQTWIIFSLHSSLSPKVSRLFAIRLDFASKVTAAMVGRTVVRFGPKNV